MNCRDIQSRLSAYIDQETSHEESMVMRSHLYECTECQLEHDGLLKLKSLFAGLPSEEPCDTLETRLLAAIERECNRQQPVRSLRTVLRPAGYMVAMFMCGFFGWLLFARLQPNSPALPETNQRFEAGRYRAGEEVSDPMSPIPSVMTTTYGQR